MRGGSESSIDPFLEAIGKAGWVEDSKGPQTVHPDHHYPEIVYFHPFVRDFLYGDGSPKIEMRTLRRFKRIDLTEVEVAIDPGSKSLTSCFRVVLRVENAELLLIRPRIAVLVLEVSNRTAVKTRT